MSVARSQRKDKSIRMKISAICQLLNTKWLCRPDNSTSWNALKAFYELILRMLVTYESPLAEGCEMFSKRAGQEEKCLLAICVYASWENTESDAAFLGIDTITLEIWQTQPTSRYRPFCCWILHFVVVIVSTGITRYLRSCLCDRVRDMFSEKYFSFGILFTIIRFFYELDTKTPEFIVKSADVVTLSWCNSKEVERLLDHTDDTSLLYSWTMSMQVDFIKYSSERLRKNIVGKSVRSAITLHQKRESYVCPIRPGNLHPFELLIKITVSFRSYVQELVVCVFVYSTMKDVQSCRLSPSAWF